MASFVHNNSKGHFGISVSELCFKNAFGLLINNRSNFWEKSLSNFLRGANYRSKIRGESSSKANYHSKNHTDQNNRCHTNAGKLRQNIVSRKTSSKSQEFGQNSFVVLLDNTVVKGDPPVHQAPQIIVNICLIYSSFNSLRGGREAVEKAWSWLTASKS